MKSNTPQDTLREQAVAIASEYFMACTGECVSLTQQIVELVESEKQKTIKEHTPVKIMGKTLDEVVVILSALEIERITGIEVTMSNLDALVKVMREDMRNATQKALDRSVKQIVDRGKDE